MQRSISIKELLFWRYSLVSPDFFKYLMTKKKASGLIVMLRRSKQNSLFIVSNFSVLHVGGWSLFRFQTSKNVQETLGSNSQSPITLKGGGDEVPYSCSIQSEIIPLKLWHTCKYPAWTTHKLTSPWNGSMSYGLSCTKLSLSNGTSIIILCAIHASVDTSIYCILIIIAYTMGMQYTCTVYSIMY